MSFSSDLETGDCVVAAETLYQNVLSSSSSDVPIEQWSSLEQVVAIDNPKMLLYKAGLYDPGSGNVCTKYIPISDSEVLRHPYYNYMGVKDPGILKALLEPEDSKMYPLDGQQLYLDLCEDMNIVPVKKFHRGMLDKVIDLKHYGVNPVGLRAMCIALTSNRYVRRLDLSSNSLSEDGCYHLGKLLGESLALREVVLSACGIQPNGMRKLTAFLSNFVLEVMDVSRNNIGDEGFHYLAEKLLRGTIIKRLNLSHNDLGEGSALALAEAVEFNNTVTHLDLSWNKMSSPKGINELLRQLSNSTVLVELNLAWNALTIGVVLKNLLAVPTLRIIDLSNNRLSTPAAKAISKLRETKLLHILDLSFNPLSPSDALTILKTMKFKGVKLNNLLMDDIVVEKGFAQELKQILALDYRKNLKITHGKVIRDYTLTDPDLRVIILKRMDFLTSKASKKCHLDTALYFLEKYKECELMQPREILRDMKRANPPVDEDLVGGLASTFPGPKTDKGGLTIKLAGIIDMIERLWPDKKLPPTPPEPEPEPEVIVKDKKAIKDNKKKVCCVIIELYERYRRQ